MTGLSLRVECDSLRLPDVHMKCLQVETREGERGEKGEDWLLE